MKLQRIRARQVAWFALSFVALAAVLFVLFFLTGITALGALGWSAVSTLILLWIIVGSEDVEIDEWFVR